MSDKKVIAVIGSTGNQGGSLINAVLAEGENSEWQIRAVTRDPTSEKAKALQSRGVEVVKANVFSPEELEKAFQGCYAAFCVTTLDFNNPSSETTQAMNMASAAKNAGVKHILYSTLDDTRKMLPEITQIPTLCDKYKVPHFDAKSDGDKYFSELPTTYLLTSFFAENFISFGLGPKRLPDGKLYLTIPMGDRKMPIIAIEDIGKCAFSILKNPNDYINKRVGLAGDQLTIAEIASKMAKAKGVEINYQPVDWDSFRKFGFPGAEEIGNMFQFYHDCEEQFCASRNVSQSKRLNRDMLNFDKWLELYPERIPIL